MSSLFIILINSVFLLGGAVWFCKYFYVSFPKLPFTHWSLFPLFLLVYLLLFLYMLNDPSIFTILIDGGVKDVLVYLVQDVALDLEWLFNIVLPILMCINISACILRSKYPEVHYVSPFTKKVIDEDTFYGLFLLYGLFEMSFLSLLASILFYVMQDFNANYYIQISLGIYYYFGALFWVLCTYIYSKFIVVSLFNTYKKSNREK